MKLINQKPTRITSIPVSGVCLTKSITDVLSSESWAGKRCLIFGGGPSLQDFNYSLIANEITVGVNKSFMIFDPTVNYCMDYTFFERVTDSQEDPLMIKRWKEYTGIRVFLKHNNKMIFSNDVYTVDKIEKEIISTDLKAGIYGSNNSGLGAIMLAIALGSRNIGLLGFDMKTYNNKTHWHTGYRKSNVSVDYYIDKVGRVLDDFKKKFEIIAPLIELAGVKVVNLNNDSALQCFKKITIQEFLKI